VTLWFISRVSALSCRVWKARRVDEDELRMRLGAIPRMRWRVVCGLREVMLIFCPIR
jgi:hypothetical protein